MYLLSRSFWGRGGGLISAFLAMSAPYIALNIFVRGAIAEYYAVAFIPWIFYALLRLFETGSPRFMLLTSISVAGLILSHNLTTMMVIPYVAVLVLVFVSISLRHSKNNHIFLVIYSLLIGLLLSA